MSESEGVFVDEIVRKALTACKKLPTSGGYLQYCDQLEDLRERLAHGTLRLAVLGQFNRGKSTFINALLGTSILPVSVLPITSVPTEIRYGAATRCTVRFGHDRPEESAKSSVKSIRELLIRYVAEESNPGNSKGVSRVIVECDSRLLHHGTVLIDTPGFGSTHRHNTKTSLELLTNCDAAIFLLSADLPITEIEVDFLRQVQTQVPEIFFVFNKVDLLSKEEIDQTITFVQGVLSSELQYDGTIPFFTVSAIAAAKKSANEIARKKSGIDNVESHIIDFIRNEKYFALSGAIDQKLRYAVTQIHSLLASRHRELIEPLETAREERMKLTDAEKKISDQLKKEIRLLDIEADALFDHLTKRGSSLKEDLGTRIREHLEVLLEGGPCDRKYAEVVIDSIERYTRESLTGGCAELASDIQRPIRKAASVHVREFERLQTSLPIALENPHHNSEENELMAGRSAILRDIEVFLPPLADQVALPGHRPGLLKMLESTGSRRERLREAMTPTASHWVSEAVRMYLDTLREKTQVIMSTLKEHVRAPYKTAIEEIRNRVGELDREISEFSRTIGPEAGEISALLESFKEIKSDIERLGEQ